MLSEVQDPSTWLSRLRHELAKVIVGLPDLIDTVILGLLCQGHVLIEGNPGLAKTLIAKTLGAILSLDFKRIQATPDLTPSDMLGTSETRGPIFAQILLVDEINRALPRTQAALLEAMEERHVSVKGRSVWLPEPFLVLATQNPIEQEGTNPLPEAQLDRFMFNVIVDYPSRAELRDIMRRTTQAERPQVEPLGDAQALRVLQRDVRERHLPDAIEDYIARLILATHLDSTLGCWERRAATAREGDAMSQRRCTTPRDDGRTGWGRPRQSLCLVITDRHMGEIGDSHLDDPHGPGLSRHAFASGTTWSMSRSEGGGGDVPTSGIPPGAGHDAATALVK